MPLIRYVPSLKIFGLDVNNHHNFKESIQYYMLNKGPTNKKEACFYYIQNGGHDMNTEMVI